MNTSGLIVAAGMSSRMNTFKPMLKIGSISMVHRIISTLQQAGVYPIVLITGNQGELLEKHVASKNVICLRNEDYENTEMFDSAKIGFQYLEDKCDQVIFTTVDIPLYTKNTVERLINAGGKLTLPTYKNKTGHPVLINNSIIPDILKYKGNEGLKGACMEASCQKTLVEVDDRGILFDADTKEDYEDLLKWHNSQILHPNMQLTLAKEQPFFDERAALLLKLIKYTNSVRYACQQLNISYSKAWNIINLMENQLGYTVVNRRPGGVNGGYTTLTEEGCELIKKYLEFEKEAKKAVQNVFERFFDPIT